MGKVLHVSDERGRRAYASFSLVTRPWKLDRTIHARFRKKFSARIIAPQVHNWEVLDGLCQSTFVDAIEYDMVGR